MSSPLRRRAVMAIFGVCAVVFSLVQFQDLPTILGATLQKYHHATTPAASGIGRRQTTNLSVHTKSNAPRVTASPDRNAEQEEEPELPGNNRLAPQEETPADGPQHSQSTSTVWSSRKAYTFDANDDDDYNKFIQDNTATSSLTIRSWGCERRQEAPLIFVHNGKAGTSLTFIFLIALFLCCSVRSVFNSLIPFYFKLTLFHNHHLYDTYQRRRKRSSPSGSQCPGLQSREMGRHETRCLLLLSHDRATCRRRTSTTIYHYEQNRDGHPQGRVCQFPVSQLSSVVSENRRPFYPRRHDRSRQCDLENL